MMSKLRKKIPVRTYSGEQWRTNKTNKKYLAKDFENRCCYCNDHHHYSGGYETFHVEHFAPKSKFPHLEFTYDNLLYACPFCNISKGDKWVGKTEHENIISDKGFINPCSKEYDVHLGRKTNGEIYYKTQIGEYMYNELKLFLDRHKTIYKLSEIRSIEKRLSERIEKKEREGKDCSKEKEIHYFVLVKFMKYLGIMYPED